MDKRLITPALVARLVETQFPEWAHLPVTAVELDGWDNTTFRLGEELSVRLPSAGVYVPQIEKEHRWLPYLAPRLPLRIPEPVAQGAPGSGFPRPWSVYRWLPGEVATIQRVDDLTRFATDLADFLAVLYEIDPADGPPPGKHSFLRGGPLARLDADVRSSIAALADEIETASATAVWEEAVASHWERPPVWVHGDITGSNLLVDSGRLTAVIDFGCSAVGDPACDLTIAWTFFHGDSRRAFRERLALDDATWARGRGWALWKALITLAKTDPDLAENADPSAADRAARRFGWRLATRAVIDEVLENA